MIIPIYRAYRHALNAWLGTLLLSLLVVSAPGRAEGLPQVIERIKPSIVGIGTVMPTRRPPDRLVATGFVVGDGRHVITNAHAVSDALDSKNKERLVVFLKDRNAMYVRGAERVAVDEDHDLALLAIEGEPLPAVALAVNDDVQEGEIYAFTGFPIGLVLGLIPVTHQAMISAITPIVLPAQAAKRLDTKVLNRLRHPFDIYQLDGTAYPGNSGSPVYRPESGEVVAVINMVFVKESKEAVLERPSGISYAIPVRYVRDLIASLP